MPKDYRRVFLAVLVVGTASLALSGVTWAESEGRLALNRNSLAVYARAGASAFVEGNANFVPPNFYDLSNLECPAQQFPAMVEPTRCIRVAGPGLCE